MNTISEQNRDCYVTVNINNGSKSACNRTNAQLEGERGEYNELFHSGSTALFIYDAPEVCVCACVCACTVTVTCVYLLCSHL